MTKKNHTIRFAFGSQESPASAVWRVTCHGKAGDIYIQNCPQLSKDTHISLHASGRFSFKAGNIRHKLEPPYEYQDHCFFGPFLFFAPFSRPLPPLRASGNKELINWLGTPDPNCIFMIKFIYVPHMSALSINSNEVHVGRIPCCRLFHKPMSFHIVLQHRSLTKSEIEAEWHVEKVDFRGNTPQAAEMIRVAKSELGPSAIILQRYVLSHAGSLES